MSILGPLYTLCGGEIFICNLCSRNVLVLVSFETLCGLEAIFEISRFLNLDIQDALQKIVNLSIFRDGYHGGVCSTITCMLCEREVAGLFCLLGVLCVGFVCVYAEEFLYLCDFSIHGKG